jgi:RNA 2',3'-cyclic 3'-phosphodiesterase
MAEPGREQARLFVAVWPPDEVAAVLTALPRPVVAGVRWTTPEQWHVTLRFLGRADVEEASAALSSLEVEPACAAVLGGRAVRLGREVLALPVEGLADLASATRTVFDGVGRPVEERPFKGHITLARGKGVRAASVPPVDALAWPVGSVALVRSDLHPTGARYTVVASAELTQP